MPGARLGYDPMRAASRDPGLARDPERLLRHIERRRDGVALAYLRFDVVVAAEARGFPLVGRLLDLGIETDAWTSTLARRLSDAALRTLVEAGVRQITTDAPTEIARRIAALGMAARDRQEGLALKTVFVLFDSLNRHILGCYGGRRMPTPNFDRLAARAGSSTGTMSARCPACRRGATCSPAG